MGLVDGSPAKPARPDGDADAASAATPLLLAGSPPARAAMGTNQPTPNIRSYPTRFWILFQVRGSFSRWRGTWGRSGEGGGGWMDLPFVLAILNEPIAFFAFWPMRWLLLVAGLAGARATG